MKEFLSESNSTSNGCPYAVALQEDEQSKEGPGIRNCPAFSDSCPFKDTNSPEDVRKKLLEVPASHMDPDGKFYQILSELHKVQEKSPSEKFDIGGCPVAQSPALQHQFKNFRDAMEDFSLAAIMARMVEEQENENVAVQESLSKDTEPAQQVEESGLLSQSLKTGTAVAHQAAEDVHFVKNFIRGDIDADVYRQMVADLFFVYQALEVALDKQAPLHFPTLHFPELLRTEPLQEDCDYWLGTNDSRRTTPSPATKDYVDRIVHLAEHDPLLLLAHSYTRYLGDLSGGKVLARVAKRALSLPPNVGLAFYKFDGIKSMKLFKDSYRKALDELDLTPSQVQAVVQEANVAFLLNVRLFEELDVKAGVKGASVRPLAEALSPSQAKLQEDASAECPFLQRQNNGASTEVPVARCPWPFVVFHDPSQFLRDWQTYALSILLAGLIWSAMLPSPTGCPWPFIFMHDPLKGMERLPTWVMLICVFCYCQIPRRKQPSKEEEKQVKTGHATGSCPWPFVLLHDPKQGMKDWKSWASVGLLASLVWSQVQ